jgi:ADP-heptose:LPS heptosyltransferase
VDDQPKAISTLKPLWDGAPRSNRLFIWAEQGIGDQILYLSMLADLDRYPQAKIVSMDKKLVPIFQRSFPNIKFVDKDISISNEDYDEQIPISSLGGLFRKNWKSFKNATFPYLLDNKYKTSKFIDKYHH